ncbi:MAG: 50S ribosomal protein L11 methyltransferase [Bdellovibrionaceae bacterium]|nr:50S ribosomal protein L11 methyltransferase [Pseudobdellovibrionaceae bacterium]
MSTNNYYELHIRHLKRDQEDAITGQLFSLGAEGVSETLDFAQTNLQFTPQIIESEYIHLVAYFSVCSSEIMDELKVRYPETQITLNEEAQKDWMEEWKKGFEPFPLTSSTWIVPSWRRAPPEAQNVIYIDPGMAFGTGTHETTRVCSELISKYAVNNPKNMAVDIGTGTGILAILMEQLGFQKIYCTDIDPECKRVSQENFEKNHVQFVQWHDQIEESLGDCDLIVANIIDSVLLQLKPLFRSLAGTKTQLILSGILQENEEEFLKNFLSDWPLQIRERQQLGEWVGVWLCGEQ